MNAGARFDGKAALVTGAASGIGRAVAERLAAEGARVFAVDIDADGLGALHETCGPSVTIHHADLTEAGAPAAVVDACLDDVGRLDVLGNIAGIYATGHARDLTVDQFRRIQHVNVETALFLSIAAVPHLIESSGSIVTVASHSGLQGVPYAVAYSMSKGALIAMTRSLAVEYLKTPMRANAIAPGGVDTAMAANATFPDDVDLDLLVRLGGHRPMTVPAEVASVFAFLASDEARSVTGAVYAVDNGLTAS